MPIHISVSFKSQAFLFAAAAITTATTTVAITALAISWWGGCYFVADWRWKTRAQPDGFPAAVLFISAKFPPRARPLARH